MSKIYLPNAPYSFSPAAIRFVREADKFAESLIRRYIRGKNPRLSLEDAELLWHRVSLPFDFERIHRASKAI